MTVLEAHNINKHYDADPVLEAITFKINKGEKVGLIGTNGCGKTTLLKLIAGVEHANGGTIVRPGNASVGYLAQALEYEEGNTVYQEILTVFREANTIAEQLRELEEQMAAGDARAMNRYSWLTTEFERLGGYDCEHRIAAIVDGLGIGALQERAVAALSGGEKNIVALAKILLQEPDILLLDEPANHLDFEGLEWQENFLKNYDKTIVLVSHNRYLLDRVIKRVFEIEDRKLEEYVGNYSAYRAEKMKKLLAQRAAYDDQQKEIERIQVMIKRFEKWSRLTDDPRHARQARSRQKQLDRMHKIERPDLDRAGIDPNFALSQRSGHIALELKGYCKAYGDQVLFEGVDLFLASGDRVGLLGSNGTGKTSLFKDLVEEGAWDHPILRLGPRTELGYYSQEHETLDPENSIVDEVRKQGKMSRDQAFTLLSRFLFAWEDMDKKVGTLSGGEKSRIQLAKLMLSDANFLLLDEPTNHLDIQSREQVEEALEEFEGTILVISHDRYFLDRIVDRIVEVDNPGLQEYAGNFSYFWRKKKTAAASPVGRKKKQRPKNKKTAAARPPAGADAARVEERIQRMEEDKLRLEKEVVEAYNRRDFKRGEKLSQDLRNIEWELEQLYATWEHLVG